MVVRWAQVVVISSSIIPSHNPVDSLAYAEVKSRDSEFN